MATPMGDDLVPYTQEYGSYPFLRYPGDTKGMYTHIYILYGAST
jgi:hypothetical protein